ncbi:MAG: pentapeptide repeat-containing protein [Candidatus Latescibacteria bacterium]|nr:pentapeptide repeat-containing protein [Candidatus Latescibacterota bacterium]
MSKSHLEILAQGVSFWNRWRKDRPQAEPELAGTSLRGQDLSGVDLHGADLREANLVKAYLSKADFREANLREADLAEANLTEACLAKAYLFKAHLGAANLTRADLSGAELFGANLSEANLREAKLGAAFLSRAALRGANLNRADLRGADLRGADLRDANLSRADLSQANLSTADLGGANLTHAILNHAQLTGAVLWETQRAGWSVFEVSCEYAFWELNGRRRLNYAPGEFERLNTTRTQIELHYPEGLSARELATLPLLLRALQRALPDHPFQLRHLEEEAGGTRLVIEFEDESAIAPELRPHLKELAEERGAELIGQQREALSGEGVAQIDTRLELIEFQLFPPEQGATDLAESAVPADPIPPLEIAALPAPFA